jgi:hypothetical protein
MDSEMGKDAEGALQHIYTHKKLFSSDIRIWVPKFVYFLEIFEQNFLNPLAKIS